MMLMTKKRFLLVFLILSALIACGLMSRPAAAAYRPEYYYFHMDTLHDTIQKNGMTGTDGTSRTNLFPVLIDPDPNYVSSKVTLPEQEKQWILTTINHETGACKVGAIMEAQVIRDAYLYFCGLYGSNNQGCPYSTIRGIITNMYSTSYLTTTPASQLLPDTTWAYSYVFEQGNSFYPMKLFTFRGWRLTSSDASLDYKEAIVMNSHYDNGSTVRWINDPTYKNIVILTNNKLITGGSNANFRNISVPTSSYTDSEPYSQTASATPSGPTNPSNPGGTDPSNPGGSTPSDDSSGSGVDQSNCANILTAFCPGNGKSITDLVRLIITILTAGTIVAGTVGMIICGYIILTSRENQEQVTKAKKRLFEIVIGLVLWVLAASLISFFLPNADTSSIESFVRVLPLH